MRIKSKPVPFSDSEEDILKYAESRKKPFATYVKDLIRKDMENKQEYSKDELKNILQGILSDMNLKPEETEKTEKALGKKGSTAYKNILKKYR